jgi:hypothetical protein
MTKAIDFNIGINIGVHAKSTTPLNPKGPKSMRGGDKGN